MNSYKKLLALLGALAGLGSSAQAKISLVDVKVDLTIGMTTCTGAGSTCNVTINAMGDLVDLDVRALPVEDLGTIDQEKLIDLSLPTKAYARKVFSYTPSTGELAGTTIYLTLENRPQAPGTRLAGKTVVKMYRQLEGDGPTDWLDVGEIFTQTAGTDLPADVPFVFTQNGNLETKNPAKQLADGTFAPVTFVLGTKNVNPK